ncbi:MAG: type II toxin-antitoxin system VapC family toxin [Chloroflexi bacterium]|nr:type II toxin-antitoxin system VapC family toxin [Chloroflexota bacterium]
MTIEPLYVVDTNALIWYLTNARKLGSQARSIFAAAERGDTMLVLSAITIAELYYADKKFRLFTDFQQLFRRLQAAPYFRFAPFQADHVLDFDEHGKIPEMHDRIIAGLARRLEAPLVTSDPEIHDAEIVVAVW